MISVVLFRVLKAILLFFVFQCKTLDLSLKLKEMERE